MEKQDYHDSTSQLHHTSCATKTTQATHTLLMHVLHRNFMLCTRYRYICCMVLLVPHRQPKRLRTRYRCICCIVQTHHIDFTEQFMTQDRNSAGGIIGLIAAMAPTHQTHHTYFCLFILLVLSYKDIKHMINMEFVYP